jgi:hypothetical protein
MKIVTKTFEVKIKIFGNDCKKSKLHSRGTENQIKFGKFLVLFSLESASVPLPA